ncbi:MAG TPA: histidine--tRNA ligase [Methanomassiliicoccales archaeon]|nr:histidine--tRNA ligase [Methanomassiliicoccales archaeon]
MIQRPRGTRDFAPKEMESRRELEAAFRSVAERHGFREIATPIFEHAELFTLKSGPNVIEEMYAFEDKGGRQIALRPELTAPAMRFFVNDLTNYPRPLKIYYFGQCFRYERPQSGRYREFFQFGAELIGAPTPESDAEVIGLAAAMIRTCGLTEHQIRVGHIGILRSMLKEAGVPPEQAPFILQKLDKKVYEEARPLMQQAGMSDASIEQVIRVTETTGGIDVLDSFPGEATDYLREVFGILEAYGFTNVKADLGVVRGLDYYTGIVFEIDAPKLGAEKQVCGGGSYSLTELFGGEKVFSTGFAIGFDRILLALEREGMSAKEHKVEAYVIPVSDAMRHQAHVITASLRNAGISADVDLMRRSIGKNFKYADAIGARFAVIVGEKEMAERSIALRDLSSGEQILVKVEALTEEVKRRREVGVRVRCGGEN